jgi:MFS family permease
MALVQTPAVAFITRSAPPVHVGMATGFVNMVRYLGLAAGPSLAAFALALTGGAAGTSGLTVSLAPAFAVVGLVGAVGLVLSIRVPGQSSPQARTRISTTSSAAGAQLLPEGKV